MDEENLDLTGVHPLLWSRARARVKAIKEYLQLPTAGPDDEARFAQSLGISSGHFRNLVRIWRLHGRAAALPGSTLERTGHPARRQRLKPEASEILSAAIRDLGPHEDLTKVQAEVDRRCGIAKINPPHPSTVLAHLTKARLASELDGEPQASPGIVIDHCAFALPASVAGDASKLPILSLAIAVPERVIIAHAVSNGPPSASMTAQLILELLEEGSSDGEMRQLHVNAAMTSSWRQLIEALKSNGVIRTGETRQYVRSGRQITRLIGRTLGILKLRPKLTQRGMRRSAMKGDYKETLLTTELEAAVSEAVAEFNVRHCAQPISGIMVVPSDHVASLQKALDSIVRD